MKNITTSYNENVMLCNCTKLKGNLHNRCHAIHQNTCIAYFIQGEKHHKCRESDCLSRKNPELIPVKEACNCLLSSSMDGRMLSL